jgi:hypothetical protein
MGSPSSSLATLRPDLASSFEEFPLEMDRAGFIGLRVATETPVEMAAGTFGKIPVEQLLQKGDTARAPGAGYGRGKWTFDKDTYATKENGWEEPVDDNESAMYGRYVNSYDMAARRAYDKVLRNLETRISAAIFNTTTWTGTPLATALSAAWSTASSSTPITNINAAVRKVRDNSGLWPNTLILTKEAFRQVRMSQQIIDIVKYSGYYDPTQVGITTRVLSQAFDLPNILVSGGTLNSADEGQSATFTNIWDPTMAMVCYLNPSMDTRVPTLARCFHWGGDGSDINGAFESYREESTRSDIVRVRNQSDEKVMYAELGHLLTGCITA